MANKNPTPQKLLLWFNYQVKHGANLIEQVFDGLTASQLKALKIKTDIQRSDSFLVASNIRKYSRLQLLIEVILRFYRILSQEDKERSISLIGEYLEKGSSERYCYDLSRNDLPKEFDRIGQIYQKLIDLFGDKYGDTEIYQIVERVFEEQFTVSKEEVLLKPPEELSSGILQSPDDIEATYRKKPVCEPACPAAAGRQTGNAQAGGTKRVAVD
ncbi:hypothetical protein KJ656_04580 [bacterium]|nr:hypothetical protein [bacterium]